MEEKEMTAFGYFTRRDFSGLHAALKAAGLPFVDCENLVGRKFRITFETENEDETLPHKNDFHILYGTIKGFHLDQSVNALVVSISVSLFGGDWRIRSLNFGLSEKQWVLLVGDDEYDDPDLYQCDFTLL